MSAAVKYLFRVFFWSAVLMGIFMSLWGVGITLCEGGGPRRRLVWAVAFALREGVWPSLVGSVLFGAGMALFLGGWHIRAVRRLGFPLTDETLAVRQQRTLTLDLPLAQAFRLCLESVRVLARTEVLEESDESSGVLLVRKGTTWNRWSDRIRFDLRDEGNRTAIRIECRPPWTTLADFGESLRNLDAIVGFLLAHEMPHGKQPASEGVQASPEGVKPPAPVSPAEQ
jgi:hypothetical protein